MQLRQRTRLVALGIIGATLSATAFSGTAFAAAGPSTERVSEGVPSVQANAESYPLGMSSNGRYVIFKSAATNLVPGDTNGNDEIYLKDTKTNSIQKVTVSFNGGEANVTADLSVADVSANGRYVVFSSVASNLVTDDLTGGQDVFVRDLKAGVTKRVSVGVGGEPNSGGGREPSISDDGRFVAFDSVAADLIQGDTNENRDIFVRDLKKEVTTRVSVGPNGIQSDRPLPPPTPAYGGERYSFDAEISGDGKSVAFSSYARNLVPNDTNNTGDVFLHTLKTGVTQRVSLATGGVESQGGYKGTGSYSPSISADGTVIVFSSVANNLGTGQPRAHMYDNYIYDLKTRQSLTVEETLDGSPSVRGAGGASISPDGRFVAFSTEDSNVVAGDTNGVSDIFVRDLQTNTYRLASVNSAGQQGNGASYGAEVSTGGKQVSFLSSATNLVPDDTNGVIDVFLHRF